MNGSVTPSNKEELGNTGTSMLTVFAVLSF